MTDKNNTISFDDGDAIIRPKGHGVEINAAADDGLLIRIKDGEGDIRSAISEIAKSLVVTVPVPDGYEEIDPMLATVDDYFQVGNSDGGYDLYRIRSIDSDGDIYAQGIGYAWNRKTRTNRNHKLENPWRVIRRITSSNGSSAKTNRPAPIRMVTLAEAEPGDIAVWKRSGGPAVSAGVISEEDGRLVVLEGDLIQGRVGVISDRWVIRSIDGTDGGGMDWFVILRLNNAPDGHKPSDFMQPTEMCTDYQTATGTRLYLDSDGDWSLPGGGRINGKAYFRWNDILSEFGPEEFPITAM
ncbi:hypothetical protein [uncultured Bifidobacterium sp.]|uniref:hypothetical protein n=1 Tax=uncultured Bifidobacterium sp. TaxID=165187 RepID=UPI0025963DBA|nr:hypothetical protein [uncultured Bifidobacterium sp.]